MESQRLRKTKVGVTKDKNHIKRRKLQRGEITKPKEEVHERKY